MPQITQFLDIIVLATAMLALSSFVLALVSLFKLSGIKKKLNVLFTGKDAKDLEKIIMQHSDDISTIDKDVQQLFEISNQLHALAMKSIHKIGIVRFNPFKDIGGDQSFALALIDGKNSGLVISSLHTREGTRIYSKPVVKGDSEKYPLTEEEKTAIKTATTVQPPKV